MDTDASRVPTWQWAWDRGIAPVMSTPALEYLRRLLAEDSPVLCQGAVALPYQEQLQNAEVDAACAIGACGMGEGLNTPRELADFFGRVIGEAARRTGDPDTVAYFARWYDYSPRAEMRAALLPRVDAALAARGAVAVAAAG